MAGTTLGAAYSAIFVSGCDVSCRDTANLQYVVEPPGIAVSVAREAKLDHQGPKLVQDGSVAIVNRQENTRFILLPWWGLDTANYASAVDVDVAKIATTAREHEWSVRLPSDRMSNTLAKAITSPMNHAQYS